MKKSSGGGESKGFVIRFFIFIKGYFQLTILTINITQN
jgi:hypothetical protein